jgi:hypothetical protein
MTGAKANLVVIAKLSGVQTSLPLTLRQAL